MNWLVFHIASGDAFFTGMLCIISGVLAANTAHPYFTRLTPLALSAGIILTVLSATPLPWIAYGILAGLLALWIWVYRRPILRKRYSYALTAFCTTMILYETSYHFTPRLASAPSQVLTVIGDSVTAGIDGDETATTWPTLVAREHGIEVVDLSHVGETCQSALKRSERHGITPSIVLLEIGGNDILGSTSANDFQVHLESLLQHLSTRRQTLVMFELPLPPFYNCYGQIQRRLAQEYHVHLVPKRRFLGILAETSSTLDTIHLTQAGHDAMAHLVWQVLEPAYASKR